MENNVCNYCKHKCHAYTSNHCCNFVDPNNCTKEYGFEKDIIKNTDGWFFRLPVGRRGQMPLICRVDRDDTERFATPTYGTKPVTTWQNQYVTTKTNGYIGNKYVNTSSTSLQAVPIITNESYQTGTNYSTGFAIYTYNRICNCDRCSCNNCESAHQRYREELKRQIQEKETCCVLF